MTVGLIVLIVVVLVLLIAVGPGPMARRVGDTLERRNRAVAQGADVDRQFRRRGNEGDLL